MPSYDSITTDILTPMFEGKYPNPLAVGQLADWVIKTVAQQVSGTLLVADIWCWTDPISPRIFLRNEAKFLLVDNNPTIELEKSHLPEYVSLAQVDMNDAKAMNAAKREFFHTHKSLGKGSFDVVLLSNILNYFTDWTTPLKPWEISPVMRNFWVNFVEKNLSKKGVVIIQNGDKGARYENLKEEQVNDYFSPAMENLITKNFIDSYYFWIAFTWTSSSNENISLEASPWFCSLKEYQVIKNEWKLLKAVNLRVLRRKS